MYNKKALRRFLPGGINDGGPGYKPFDPNTGYGIGIGQNTSAYNQFSPDQSYLNSLLGISGPSSLPKSSGNRFDFITMTGTGSYDETKNTGHTLGDRGQEIIPGPPEPQPQEQSDLVAQERKKKNFYNVDGEALVNVKNAAARGILGYVDRLQNNKIGYNLQLDNADITKQMGTTAAIDQGDWVGYGQQTGQFRQPEMGQNRNSRATFGNFAGDSTTAQSGGFMKHGGSHSYSIGQEVYMAPDQLKQFLAAGGEVDYI